MDLGLADRSVLVTGGSSGVGLATVRMLLAEGARVATCAPPRRRPHQLPSRTRRTGPAAHHAPCDVRDSGVEAFTEPAADRFGGLDGLVNNAGPRG